MAGITASSLSSIINYRSLPEWIAALNLNATFLFNVLGGFVPHNGHYSFTVKTAGNSTAGSFAESADLSTAGSQTRVRVVIPWKQYYVTISSTGLQEALVNAGGYENLASIITDGLRDGMKDVFKEINTHLLTSGSGNDSYGVYYYNATSESVGGDNTDWTAQEDAYVNASFGDQTRTTTLAGYLVSAATASFSSSFMNTVHAGIRDDRGEDYDQVWMSETNLQSYEHELKRTGNVQYIDANFGDARFRTLSYAGKPVIAIPGYPNDRVDMVQSDTWELAYLPFNVGEETEGAFKVIPLSTTGDVKKFTAVLYCNLVCKNPYSNGAVVSIA